MITRMFGLPLRGGGATCLIGGAGAGLGGGPESPVASATALIARPAPSTPPAARPPLRNVRRSTLLFSSRSMLSMRALILGPALALGIGPLAARAAAAQPGPTCTPATLNNSALQHGSVTVSPLSGSRDASPHAQISFRGVPAARLSAVSVVGSRTGPHAGRLAAHSQGDGASFVPARPFAEGERVTVKARLRSAGSTAQLLDRFAIAREDSISSTPETIHPGRLSEVQAFFSRPDLHPPVVTVT